MYSAHDLLLDQRVALKTLGPEIAGRAGGFDRLRAEVLAARAVTHPNVCRIYDLFPHVVSAAGEGVSGEIAVMAMELLDGETLDCRLRRRALTDEEVQEIAYPLAEGLAAAHAAGVLHLDLKSSNVLLVSTGGACRPVIVDFGLARAARGSRRPGAAGGTPGYMSPEQARGEPLSPAADVYAFGCVLHEMLTCRVPGSSAEPLGAAVGKRWLEPLTLALARSPKDRCADGTELLAALSMGCGRGGPRARAGRSGWRAAGGFLALSSAALLASGPPPAPLVVDSAPTESVLAPAAEQGFASGVRWLWLLEPGRAREVLLEAVEAAPEHPGIHLGLAEAFEALGSVRQARAETERAAELAAEGASRTIRTWAEGRQLEIDGELGEAADRYRTLLALEPQSLGHLARLVKAHLRGGRAEAAEIVLAPYLEAAAGGADDARLAVLDAQVAFELGKSEAQLAAARRAIELALRDDRFGIEAVARLLEGSALRRLGQDDNGLASTERSLELFTLLESPVGRLSALRALASLHTELDGRWDLATAEYDEALRIARRLEDRVREAGVLSSWAADTFLSGDLELAEERFRQAREIYRQLDDESGLAQAAGNLGLIHLERGQFRQAEAAFEQALALRRRTGPPSAAISLLNNVGSLYALRGESRRARDAWEDCAELSAGSGRLLMELISRMNLAGLDLLDGEVDAASERLERVWPRLAALDTPLVTSEGIRLAGDLAAARDDETAALAAVSEALDLLDGIGEHSQAAGTRQQLAGLHLRYGRFERAEELARRGARELMSSGQRGAAAPGQYYLLQALLGQDRLEEAGETLAALVDDVPEDDVRHLLLAALGRSRLALARGEAERAIAEIESGLDAVPVGYLVPLRFEATLLLAEAESELGRPQRSAERLQRLAADAERGGFVYFARLAAESQAAALASRDVSGIATHSTM